MAGLGDTVTGEGKFLPSGNLQDSGGERLLQCTAGSAAMGLFGVLCTHVVEALNQIKCAGGFLDDVKAHLICKTQVGVHEANFIWSQKAKDPASAKARGEKEHAPF